ncbi:hypothetical protein [Kibdelosporangium phytohabitans]|uniref:Uncharacterized protein n=1 Tax=Kibdelosporangium phytohabitans TaxID=860235 RepID=A0A0N9HZL7_9PSEU|nr:hypothetical protein [Kibdelosporangium phytohabitans]ALG12771.1 hypothetical protein AOZ06_43230 [Kibdelosporangium phytohabitans]MBE1464447.1 hypothetical protein [Kibdelosporangium phytohabitans]
MTNWGQLTHAYGTAEDIQNRLDQVAAEPSADWDDLWSALCHQGTVYSASFAALHRLARIAATGDTTQRAQALALAGAIVGSADRPPDAGDVHAMYAEDIATLLRVADQYRSTVTDKGEYLYLMQSILAFEGHDVGNDPLKSLANEEYEVECPNCTAMSFVAIGSHGYFATIDDYAIEDDTERTDLVPADPASLGGLRRRLYDDALAHGHPDVAIALSYLFGRATCVECGDTFSVAEQAEIAF